jgi:hypothetical protein
VLVLPEFLRPPTAKPGAGSGAGHGIPGGAGGGGGKKGTPLGTGDVSFRIYWEPPVHDIDLHVIDPHGHHLWYRETACPCGGRLDRDDTTSGGPENIFWPKGKGPQGEYRYFALYYSGAGPKTVTIQLRREERVVAEHKVVLRHWREESQKYLCQHPASSD